MGEYLSNQKARCRRTSGFSPITEVKENLGSQVQRGESLWRRLEDCPEVDATFLLANIIPVSIEPSPYTEWTTSRGC